MIVDTSALISIAFGEPDAERLVALLRVDPSPRISAANMLETYVVIDARRGTQAATIIDESVTPIGLIIEPVTEAQVHVAHDAYRRFGRGSGHPARLNFGDRFAYALASFLDEPLLYIGNDFAQTDIARATCFANAVICSALPSATCRLHLNWAFRWDRTPPVSPE